MTDFPGSAGLTTPRGFISTFGKECAWYSMMRIVAGGSTVATGWQVANTGIIIPFVLNTPFMVRQVMTENGATIGASYDVTWWDRTLTTKLFTTGSVAQSGTSALQIVDVTDTLIPAGETFVTFNVNNTTGLHRLSIGGSATAFHLAGIRQFAGAVPVASSITPAQASTMSNVPYIGFASKAVA
jgi:hypothetical protein